MARRHIRRTQRSGSRGRYRPKQFTATCSVCETQIQVAVQPPPDVELTCVDCHAKLSED